MAIILQCDLCGNQMRSLDPHFVVDGKYICSACNKKIEYDKEIKKKIEEIYDGISADEIPFII